MEPTTVEVVEHFAKVALGLFKGLGKRENPIVPDCTVIHSRFWRTLNFAADSFLRLKAEIKIQCVPMKVPKWSKKNLVAKRGHP